MPTDRRIEKFSEMFPIGCKVMYRNPHRRGDGNIAQVVHYLHRTGEQETVAAIQLRFNGGGNHYVTPNQLKTYYSKIS